jgi:hypothetical protein
MNRLHKSEILRGAKDIDLSGCYVYFLLAEKEIIYIGCSAAVLNRINSHKSDKIFDSYFIQKMPDLKNGLIMETEYIKTFQPKYNIKDNPVSPKASYSRKHISPETSYSSRHISPEIVRPLLNSKSTSIKLKNTNESFGITNGQWSKVNRGGKTYFVLNKNNTFFIADWAEKTIYSHGLFYYKPKGFFGKLTDIVFT